MNFFSHASSVIDPGARIGDGTNIWHFSHIMPGAVIGSNCNLGQNVFIDNNVQIGNRVKIQNNVSVYNSVRLEDDVFIGPSAVFTNVINPRSFVERKSEFKSTIIRKGATIGANSTILCGITVGEYALIGAGAVVTKDVLPYEIITGNPGKHGGWISIQGNKLHFDTSQYATDSNGDTYQLKGNRIIKMKN